MNDVVPIIDFAGFADDDPSQLTGLAQAVDHALSSVGFMAIRNLGIDAQMLASVFEQSRAFFNSDARFKQKSAYRSAAENFGYQGMAQEHLDPTAPADLKETFTMRNVLQRPPEDERWPSAPFQSLMCAFYRECFEAAYRLMRVLDLALDNEPGFFRRYHTGENTTLRLLHYPSVENDTIAPDQLGAGAHTDYGLMTLLFQSGVSGLEVQTADGRWHAVAADRDAVVINAGDLLEVWTNGRYRSTPHRVQPKRGCDERQSIAMFVDPDSATEVTALPSCVSAAQPARFAPTSAGAHLQAKIEASHKARLAN